MKRDSYDIDISEFLESETKCILQYGYKDIQKYSFTIPKIPDNIVSDFANAIIENSSNLNETISLWHSFDIKSFGKKEI